MKIIRLCIIQVLFVVLWGLFTTISAAQKRNIITTNPVSIYFNSINISYERLIKDKIGISFEVGGNLLGDGEYSDTKFNITYFIFSYKSYLKKDAPKGLWSGISTGYYVGDY